MTTKINKIKAEMNETTGKNPSRLIRRRSLSPSRTRNPKLDSRIFFLPPLLLLLITIVVEIGRFDTPPVNVRYEQTFLNRSFTALTAIFPPPPPPPEYFLLLVKCRSTSSFSGLSIFRFRQLLQRASVREDRNNSSTPSSPRFI